MPSLQFFQDPVGWLRTILNDQEAFEFSDDSVYMVIMETYRHLDLSGKAKMRGAAKEILSGIAENPLVYALTPGAKDDAVLITADLYSHEGEERLEVIRLMETLVANPQTERIITSRDKSKQLHTLHERAAQGLVILRAIKPVSFWRSLGERRGFYRHVAMRGMILADFDAGFTWTVERINDEDIYIALERSLPYLYDLYRDRCRPYVERAIKKLGPRNSDELKKLWKLAREKL